MNILYVVIAFYIFMQLLVHLFLPHHSNNHRAKFLHPKSLLLMLVVVFFLQALFTLVSKSSPAILGVATDINVEKLLGETNRERRRKGLSPLALNRELSLAAFQKAQDMFFWDYWAHFAPNGTTPWFFIQEAGYEYAFAGENLAKDFQYSEDVVKAWMASPKHKENVLSSNFDDIGFAVVNGKLLGKETTLVVQMFGKKMDTTGVAQAPRNIRPPPSTSQAQDVSIVHGVTKTPLIDASSLIRNMAFTFLSLLIGVLFIDMIIVRRRKIVRLAGHSFDHILFLTGPLLLTVTTPGGSIL